MATVSVIVGYQPDGDHRDRAWRWIRRRWQMMLPDVEIITADDGQNGTGHLFSCAKAKNRGAQQASGEVLIFADCDTVFDPAWVMSAVWAVNNGAARWALPRWYVKLTEQASEQLLARPPYWPGGGPYEYRGGSSWAGCLIVPRAGYEAAGGYDERFTAWSPDDMAFAMSLITYWGPVTRLPGEIWHLWHPQNPVDYAGHDGFPAMRELARQYHEAVGDPAKMRFVYQDRPPHRPS